MKEKSNTIIAIHIPKTAGLTLLHYLRQHFNVYEDNKLVEVEIAKLNKEWKRPSLIEAISERSRIIAMTSDYNCIAGHFYAKKYKFYPNAKFITFVRDPLERMMSNYFFWKKVYEAGNPGKDPYLDSIFKRNISLSEFLLEKKFKNYQYTFVKEMNLEKFSFIGVADRQYFSHDVKYLFETVLKCSIQNSEIKQLNATNYDGKIPDIDLNAFKKFHKKDYEIYNYALEKRRKRLGNL